MWKYHNDIEWVLLAKLQTWNNNGNACSDFSGKRTIGSLKNPLINKRSNTKPLRNEIKLS